MLRTSNILIPNKHGFRRIMLTLFLTPFLPYLVPNNVPSTRSSYGAIFPRLKAMTKDVMSEWKGSWETVI